jgi:hypothetical protein
VASPTGDEAALAIVIAGVVIGRRADGRVQPIDERQANAWGIGCAVRGWPTA